MSVWEFELSLIGAIDDATEEQLIADGYEIVSGSGETDGRAVFSFSIEHDQYVEALMQAARWITRHPAVRRAFRAAPTPLHCVTELKDDCSVAEIAERSGRSVESIRKYASGERGASATRPFPAPTRQASWGASYSWQQVAAWLCEFTDWSPDPEESVRFGIDRSMNAFLAAQRTPAELTARMVELVNA